MEGISGVIAAHVALTILCQSMAGYTVVRKAPWSLSHLVFKRALYAESLITAEQATEIRAKLTDCLSNDFLGAVDCFRSSVPKQMPFYFETQFLDIWASTRAGSREPWSDKIE